MTLQRFSYYKVKMFKLYLITCMSHTIRIAMDSKLFQYRTLYKFHFWKKSYLFVVKGQIFEKATKVRS